MSEEGRLGERGPESLGRPWIIITRPKIIIIAATILPFFEPLFHAWHWADSPPFLGARNRG